MSSGLLRSRKARAGTDYVCEWLFGPLAHIVVLTLAPLRAPPPLVVCANGSAGALVGFLALTTVLNVNFNVERLYRGGTAAAHEARQLAGGSQWMHRHSSSA